MAESENISLPHSLPLPSPGSSPVSLLRWETSFDCPQPYFNNVTELTTSVSLSSISSSPGSAIEKIATLISAFAFEKAKEDAAKHSSQKTTDQTLSALLVSLSNISNTERQYMNLSFLAPKGFLRKDSNLRGVLEQIRNDLKKLLETSYSKPASELIFFVSMRIDLVDFYSKLALLGSSKNVEVIDLLSDLDLITEKFANEKKAFLEGEGSIELPSTFNSIGWEIEALSNLLKAHVAMQNWEFFNSVIALQEGQKLLSDWSDYLQRKEFSKKSSFLSGSGGPVLYFWLFKLKATLLSKFSLYFYEVLVENSNPACDIRVISTKLQTDYFNKITSYLKKCDALCICLVFDARSTPFHPNGYQHPARPMESPKGLESFPAVLAVPIKPVAHWPSIVMLIGDSKDDLEADKFIGFYDSSSKVQATFYLQRIDTRMYLLTVYESKKSEKDSYVMKFMQELAGELRCGKIFANLKAIAK